MYTYVFMLRIGDWSTRTLNQDKLDFDFSVGLTLEIRVRLSHKVICQDYQESGLTCRTVKLYYHLKGMIKVLSTT